MAGFVSISGTDPLNSSATVLGSGYYIGDHLILTAGHVLYFFNEADSVASRATRQLSGYSESTLNLRDYAAHLRSYYLGLSDPLPSNRDTDEEVKGDVSNILKDTIFINGSSDVDSGDAGVTVFLNSADMVSADYGFANGSDDIKIQRKGSTTDSSDGTLSFASPGGFLIDSANAGPGG